MQAGGEQAAEQEGEERQQQPGEQDGEQGRGQAEHGEHAGVQAEGGGTTGAQAEQDGGFPAAGAQLLLEQVARGQAGEEQRDHGSESEKFGKEADHLAKPAIDLGGGGHPHRGLAAGRRGQGLLQPGGDRGRVRVRRQADEGLVAHPAAEADQAGFPHLRQAEEELGREIDGREFGGRVTLEKKGDPVVGPADGQGLARLDRERAGRLAGEQHRAFALQGGDHLFVDRIACIRQPAVERVGRVHGHHPGQPGQARSAHHGIEAQLFGLHRARTGQGAAHSLLIGSERPGGAQHQVRAEHLAQVVVQMAAERTAEGGDEEEAGQAERQVEHEQGREPRAAHDLAPAESQPHPHSSRPRSRRSRRVQRSARASVWVTTIMVMRSRSARWKSR